MPTNKGSEATFSKEAEIYSPYATTIKANSNAES